EAFVEQLAALPSPVAIQQPAARCSVWASRWVVCESWAAVNWWAAIPADAMPVVPSRAAAMASPILFIVRANSFVSLGGRPRTPGFGVVPWGRHAPRASRFIGGGRQPQKTRD